MLLVRTYLALSPIDGLGVFAAEPIPAGTAIWRLEPDFDRLIRRASYREAPLHIREFLDRYAYPHSEDAELLILDADHGRFMNHDADPNTDFSQVGVGWARRDIAAGEEITADYGEFFDGYTHLHAVRPSRSASI